jgi:hypothetical protein
VRVKIFQDKFRNTFEAGTSHFLRLQELFSAVVLGSFVEVTDNFG